MKNEQRETVRAIRIISREIFKINGKIKNGVIHLASGGRGFEILRNFSQNRRMLILNKVRCVLEAASYFGNEEALSTIVSPKERTEWVLEYKKCEICDNLNCVMRSNK